MPPAEAVSPPSAPANIDAFLRNPSGQVSVGRIPADLAKAIAPPGAALRPDVVLSEQTMAKQLARHPDLGEVPYQLLPAQLQTPEVALRVDANKIALLRSLENGYAMVAIVKSTRAGDRLFLVSLYRARWSDVRRLIRKHAVLLGAAAVAGWMERIGAPKGPPTNPS